MLPAPRAPYGYFCRFNAPAQMHGRPAFCCTAADIVAVVGLWGPFPALPGVTIEKTDHPI
jgi:hypothetical protein